jgi:hypothetical protein
MEASFESLRKRQAFADRGQGLELFALEAPVVDG